MIKLGYVESSLFFSFNWRLFLDSIRTQTSTVFRSTLKHWTTTLDSEDEDEEGDLFECLKAAPSHKKIFFFELRFMMMMTLTMAMAMIVTVMMMMMTTTTTTTVMMYHVTKVVVVVRMVMFMLWLCWLPWWRMYSSVSMSPWQPDNVWRLVLEIPILILSCASVTRTFPMNFTAIMMMIMMMMMMMMTPVMSMKGMVIVTTSSMV